jgi:hypothetical protein
MEDRLHQIFHGAKAVIYHSTPDRIWNNKPLGTQIWQSPTDKNIMKGGTLK